MRTFFIARIFLFSIPFFFTIKTFAWWDQPHQLIASMAKQNLGSVTYGKVMALLKEPLNYPGSERLSANTSEFETAASWADAILLYSDQTSNQKYRFCHYTDLEMDSRFAGTDINEISARKALSDSLNKNNVNSISCLKSAIKILIDDKQSFAGQAIALRFLLHLVGDIVQPLHNISLIDNGMSDGGGNGTDFSSTVWIPTTSGVGSRQTRLHGLWDGTLGYFLQYPYNKDDAKMGIFSPSDLDLNKYYSIYLQSQKYLKEIFNTSSDEEQSIENWVIEAYQIAAKEVYSDLSLTWGTYSVSRYEIVQKQIVKASFLLSSLLNVIFDSKHSKSSFKKIVSDIKNDALIKPLIIP